MGIFGSPSIEKMKSKKNIEGLIKALSCQKDSLERDKAARALGEIGDPQAIESLIAALKDEDVNVIEAAAEALGMIGKPALEPLFTALMDDDSRVREAVAKALGKTDKRAVNQFVAALKNKNVYVHGPAAKALIFYLKFSFEQLLAFLKDEDSDVRQHAALALGAHHDPRAIEPLLAAALNDKNVFVYLAAGEALGNIGKPALEPLLIAIKDEDSDVRRRAASLLGKLSDPRAYEALRAALKDEIVDVRRSAAENLIINKKLSFEQLIGFCKDTDWRVRQSAAYALGKLGEPRAVDPLIAFLKDEDWRVRHSAAGALGEYHESRVVEPLVATLNDANDNRDVRKASAESLRIIYFSGVLSTWQKEYKLIESFKGLITAMITGVKSKKDQVLKRAEDWWLDKPDPKYGGFVCDVCNGEIRAKEGTSLLGSYMRCRNCTEKMFERWDKGED
jgi:HEAT repeat protein